ncbi:MAG TPA: hypothetical protein VGK64_29365 [Bryobacteraceae bacterium]
MPDQTFQFGVFEVNARAGELRKNGTRIKVQEQPFQILLSFSQSLLFTRR